MRSASALLPSKVAMAEACVFAERSARSALSVVSSSDQSPAVSGISIVIWSCGVRSPCKPSCERVTKLCSVLVCAPSSLR